jgi:hypothetical protein
MVIYTTKFIPKAFDGITIWPFILMRMKDDALLAHEMVHYKEQAWIAPIWWIRYALDRKFRVAAEARAYKVQMAAGMSIYQAARWLMKYDSRLKFEDAMIALS